MYNNHFVHYFSQTCRVSFQCDERFVRLINRALANTEMIKKKILLPYALCSYLQTCRVSFQCDDSLIPRTNAARCFLVSITLRPICPTCFIGIKRRSNKWIIAPFRIFDCCENCILYVNVAVNSYYTYFKMCFRI